MRTYLKQKFQISNIEYLGTIILFLIYGAVNGGVIIHKTSPPESQQLNIYTINRQDTTLIHTRDIDTREPILFYNIVD